jgi:hypothetical protein
MLKSSTLISASVNERGEFTFFAVPPGNYSLQVSDPQIVSTVQLLSVGSPEGIPDLELRVSAGVQVRGRIEETLGRPVENVQVRLKPDESSDVIELTEEPPGARQLSFSSTATTSAAMLRFYSVTDVRRSIVAAIQPRIVPVAADGTFGLRRIVPGRYTLQVFVGGLNSFSREIEVGAGDNERRVSLPFTLVAGRILNEDGSRLPSLSGLVRMVPSDPNAPMLFGFPDDAGRFSVLMPPGQYRVFTDTLNVGRNVLSVSDGVKDLRSDAFFLDGTRSAEIRITLKN